MVIPDATIAAFTQLLRQHGIPEADAKACATALADAAGADDIAGTVQAECLKRGDQGAAIWQVAGPWVEAIAGVG